MRHAAVLWSLITLAGLAAGAAWPGEPAGYEEEGEEEGMEMGPPPPGYWRILGDAVRGWKPADMHSHSLLARLCDRAIASLSIAAS